MHHHNFAILSQKINAFEKLLAAFNVQPKFVDLTLQVTSLGSIQHPVLFCKVHLMLFVIFII